MLVDEAELEELAEVGSLAMVVTVPSKAVDESLITSVAFWPTLSLAISAWLTAAVAISGRGKSTVARVVPLPTLLPTTTLHDSITAPLGTQTKRLVVISPVLLWPWAPCQSLSAVFVLGPKVPLTVPLK